MLQHVVKTEVLDEILSGVDLLIRIVEIGFDHKSRRISVPASRSVVGASVAALSLNIRDVAILSSKKDSSINAK